MCGLAAILSCARGNAIVSETELSAIRDAMAARGPDGAGSWLSPDRQVGLAHRRLSIIDLSDAGSQPMSSADGRLVVAYNGEIYNYRELRAELQAQGISFRTHSDTEIILELYRRDGIAMLGRLRGMFAIALWDSQAQGLLLARDPFGIKPLYVAEDANGLKAASQVKALLAGGGIDSSPDPAGHVGFFLWGHVSPSRTRFTGPSAPYRRALGCGGTWPESALRAASSICAKSWRRLAQGQWMCAPPCWRASAII